MPTLKSLFHSRDKPQNSLGGSRYNFFYGSTTAGKPVNEQTAMQMTAVYSCVRILSETVAGLPLHVYRYNDSGGKEKDLKHPLYKLLHDEPNPEMTSFAFRETLMSHLLLWGNAYAQVIRNARGEVVALYPLMPNRMTVDRDKNGHLYYMYLRSEGDAPSLGKSSQVILAPSDVLASQVRAPLWSINRVIKECIQEGLIDYKNKRSHVKDFKMLSSFIIFSLFIC